ncbi:hypothetical protein PISMIDRAFT_444638 [Pisolithus microcarpus 441]|uniref:Uncharacterized protein n=1 Tax=Pisolithus microcarpus 441 TaxID=765257 RepID=A0A0D0ACM1_9AGAM|nr:hypothetical protein PISMIDRAFT_444638 [Pisolithus microcarpus 441]
MSSTCIKHPNYGRCPASTLCQVLDIDDKMKRWLQDTKGVQPWKVRLSRVGTVLLDVQPAHSHQRMLRRHDGVGKRRVFSGCSSCAI